MNCQMMALECKSVLGGGFREVSDGEERQWWVSMIHGGFSCRLTLDVGYREASMVDLEKFWWQCDFWEVSDGGGFGGLVKVVECRE